MVFAGISLTNGQVVKKTKQLSKTFPVDNTTLVDISNKYGNVNIITWDKDSVRIDINLNVKGKKQDKVDKTFSMIDFELEATKFYINAHTLFIGNNFWTNISDKSDSFFGSKTITNIVYNIYMPETARLKVNNKYGNIYMEDHSGDVEVQLSNGDLNAGDLSGNVQVTSEFGIVDIHNAGYLKLNIKYGGLYLKYADLLDVISKSSEFHLSKAMTLKLNSKRDKFFVDYLQKIKGQAEFSYFEIKELNSSLDLAMKYGDLDIKYFGDNLTSFKLQTENTNVTLHFPGNNEYHLDALVTKETEVYYSASITNIKQNKLKDDKELILVECVVGKGKVVPMKVNANSGTLSLKTK